MTATVECYAGTRYPERPRAFVHDGERLAVTAIERQERTPDGLRFRVRGSDGGRYLLAYDERRDAWDVQRLEAA